MKRLSQLVARLDGDRERGRGRGVFGFTTESAKSVLLLSIHGRPMVGVLGPDTCQMSSCVKWQSFVAVHACSLWRNTPGDLRMPKLV